MSTKRLISLLLLLFLCTPINGQTSRLSLQQLLDSIEQIMEEEHIPGLMLSIVKRDSLIYQGGLGWANITRKEMVTEEHLFRQADISKTLGALAVLKLVEQGRLSLDDELRLIAPEINFSNPYELTHPVRVVHLLEHTSGFDDIHLHAIYNYTFEEPTGRELIDIHASSFTSRWLPGSRYAYTGAGYAIITFLIEKLSGMPYGQYISSNILQPMGIEYSNFSAYPSKENTFATGYKIEGGDYQTVPFWSVKSGVARSFNSCSEDMTRLLWMFLNNGMVGNTPLFTPDQLTRMEKPKTGITARSKMEVGYGLGNFTMHLKAPVLFHGHKGSIDGFGSQFAYNRELGVGYALANNANGDNARIASLIAHFLVREFSIRQPDILPIDSLAVAPFLGYYDKKNPQSELFNIIDIMFKGRRLVFENDTLYLQKNADSFEPIFQVDEMLFAREGENTGSIKLTTSGTSELVLSNGFEDYYERSSLVRPWVFRVLVFGALTNMLLMLLLGLLWLLSYWRKSLSKIDFIVRIMPFLASVAFLLAAWVGFYTLNDLIEAATVNWKTIVLFSCSLLFGLFTYIGVWLNARYYKAVSSKLIAFYLLVSNLFFSGLVSYMGIHGMIGLMLWSY